MAMEMPIRFSKTFPKLLMALFSLKVPDANEKTRLFLEDDGSGGSLDESKKGSLNATQ